MYSLVKIHFVLQNTTGMLITAATSANASLNNGSAIEAVS